MAASSLGLALDARRGRRTASSRTRMLGWRAAPGRWRRAGEAARQLEGERQGVGSSRPTWGRSARTRSCRPGDRPAVEPEDCPGSSRRQLPGIERGVRGWEDDGCPGPPAPLGRGRGRTVTAVRGRRTRIRHEVGVSRPGAWGNGRLHRPRLAQDGKRARQGGDAEDRSSTAPRRVARAAVEELCGELEPPASARGAGTARGGNAACGEGRRWTAGRDQPAGRGGRGSLELDGARTSGSSRHA